MRERESTSRVALRRKHHGIVVQAIERWLHGGIVDEQTAARLSDSIVIATFDWQRTARYAFIISIFCLVIAVGAILADEVLMRLLRRIFNAPAIVKCGFFAAVSAAMFWCGLFLRKRYPYRLYGNESVFFLGVLALAASVFFLGVAIDTGTGHYSILFLIASILYALLGLWFPSKLVWVFGLLSLGAWMGTETGYVSGHGMYFLGMNYPLRFVIFGAALAALGIAGQHSFADASSSASSLNFKDRLLSMSPQTKVIGLLNLFVALWIMSIFGNYGDMTQWGKVRQYELLHWSVLFGAAAIAAIWYGLRQDDGVLRGFGLTFLFINLYTRFFEYFWDSVHKAVFFAVLAVSFWYVGSKAETIWHIGQQPNKGVQPTPASGRA
jgi:MFS family permease